MHLINEGVRTIFYPGVAYERPDIKNTADCYNCPIVASYSENIKNNMEELKERNIRFLNPFISFKYKDGLVKRIIEVFGDFGIDSKTIKRAVEKGFAEWDRFREDMH